MEILIAQLKSMKIYKTKNKKRTFKMSTTRKFPNYKMLQ